MSLFAPVLNYLWSNADTFGFDPAELFREVGIDPAVRLDINARVDGQQADKLILLAKQKSQDENFEFSLVNLFQPSFMGSLGIAWQTSACLRDAFGRMERYSRIVNKDLIVRTQQQGDAFQVTLESAVPEDNAAVRETLRLSQVVKLSRMVHGESFCPTRVQTQQITPPNIDAWYKFFGCELIFGTESTTIFIPVSVVDDPLPGFNPQIVQQMDMMAIDYLATLDKNDFVGRTRAEILKQLPSGEASLEDVAAALCVSERSLTRKLKEQNESFKNLLATTRRELCEKYILDKGLSLTEISFLLGFSETSSFSRAYKTWTGQSPSAHREAL